MESPIQFGVTNTEYDYIKFLYVHSTRDGKWSIKDHNSMVNAVLLSLTDGDGKEILTSKVSFAELIPKLEGISLQPNQKLFVMPVTAWPLLQKVPNKTLPESKVKIDATIYKNSNKLFVVQTSLDELEKLPLEFQILINNPHFWHDPLLASRMLRDCKLKPSVLFLKNDTDIHERDAFALYIDALGDLAPLFEKYGHGRTQKDIEKDPLVRNLLDKLSNLSLSSNEFFSSQAVGIKAFVLAIVGKFEDAHVFIEKYRAAPIQSGLRMILEKVDAELTRKSKT